MFAIPFNGQNPDVYIRLANKYKDHLDYIYIDCNDCYCNANRYTSYLAVKKNLDRYLNNCKEFLQKRDTYIPVMMDISQYVNDTVANIEICLDTMVIPQIKEYNIEGVIVSDTNIAGILYDKLGTTIELHFKGMNHLRSMYSIEKLFRIQNFILPEYTLRDKAYMGYIAEARNNYKSNNYNFFYEAVVNNTDLYGDIYYNQKWADKSLRKLYSKYHPDKYNELRRNWVLPRWLKLYDNIIDTYIIEGLYEYDTNKLFHTLDCYINRSNDIKLSELVHTITDAPVADIQNKLYRCMCSECDVSCTACDKRKLPEFDPKRY